MENLTVACIFSKSGNVAQQEDHSRIKIKNQDFHQFELWRGVFGFGVLFIVIREYRHHAVVIVEKNERTMRKISGVSKFCLLVIKS